MSSSVCSGTFTRTDCFTSYGNENLTAALGMPFVNTVQHLLETDITDPDHPHLVKDCEDKTGKPQKPERPPNATHTQLVYPYLTHREEPTVSSTAWALASVRS